MKRNKFKDLITIASKGVDLPDTITIEEMEVDKYIYLQDDTLNPVILSFANFISTNLFNKKLFNIKLKKTEESLCFAKIMEDGEDDTDDTESEALRLLILMEALNLIFNLKNKNDIDLTNLVVNWRKALAISDENEEVDPYDHTKTLILNNIKILENRNKNRLINE